ncbi:hypothetical protein MKW94_004361 [Papaver nudicaule]|uniref:Uncharacterized protein n=1 Tax=Papaver nudicaule TaxID=74823 RepID=A0AA42B211_PAPNU|nr:hypothetical protein [Papaver nudicaule]
MFGRVRATSLDSLELERPKIIKHDSHSIYEITLQKLRLGSGRALTPSSSTDSLNASSTEAKRTDAPPPPPSSADTLKASSTEAMKIDAPPLSTSTPSSCCIGESIHICSKQTVDCTSVSESKCKKGLWIHHDFGIVSVNLESRPLGQKV